MSEQPPKHEHEDPREGQQTELHIRYSPEADVEIVQETIKELDELREQGYSPHLPPTIESNITQGNTPTIAEVTEAVEADYAIQEYEAHAADILHDWSEQQEDFLRKLATLGQPLQEEYLLTLTKYGVGGEYKRPNIVIVNIKDSWGASFTIAHEIIHLTIEQIIEEHHLDDHWTIERIVDRIFGKFYPDRATIQRDPPNTKQIDDLIEQYFPDVSQIVAEIAKLEPEDK